MPIVSEISVPVMGAVEKLTKLYNILRYGRRAYELMAFRLKDKQLQQTIFGIAQECSQYAAEVFAQIYCMGGSSLYPAEEDNRQERTAEEKTMIENISEACELCENEMLPVYRDLQKEPMLIDELQHMLSYQMKGFLYYTEQLKLLRTSSS